MKPIKCTILLISCLITSQVFAEATSSQPAACPQFPYFQPKTGPLAVLNCDFHTEYEKQVAQMLNTFGKSDGIPVIINLGDQLIFLHHNKRDEADIGPPAYHQLKAFSHANFAIYLALTQIKPGAIDENIKGTLRSLQSHLQQATNTIPTLELTSDERIACKTLADSSIAFINKVVTAGKYTQTELDAYYRSSRASLKKIAVMGGLIKLKLLDATMNKWLQTLTAQEKSRLGVAVATAHQARFEEISLQYFAKKLGFKYGQGAQYENRFVVVEGKFDEQSALTLLARHYLDRKAAGVIFAEPDYLQHDALADAGKVFIGGMDK